MRLDTPLGPFDVFEEGTITRALQAGQWWDDHLKPILDAVPAGGYAIDIGAHVGWFTRYLSHRHAVIAVEPYPPAFVKLQENIQADLPWGAPVQAWPLAAYDRVCSLGLDTRNDLTDAGTFGFTRATTPLGTLWVPAVPLDLYLLATAEVRVIKCDAQGADLKALRGLQSTISRCQPVILFEWEEAQAGWHGDVWQNYLDFFWELSYTVERVTTDYWDYVARPRA